MIPNIQMYGASWDILMFMFNLLGGISYSDIIDLTVLDNLFDQVGAKAITELAVIRHG